MPQLTQLSAELHLMRSGRGPRRVELRLRLAAVDAGLRRGRNVERLKLAQIQHLLRSLDTRQDPAALPALEKASTARLNKLDQPAAAQSPKSAR